MDFQRSEEGMEMSCQGVWRDISDYIDEDLDPVQEARLRQHFSECRHCTALLDGMRNVIALYRDERVLAPPYGFHERLRQRLGEGMKSSRRFFLTWALPPLPSLWGWVYSLPENSYLSSTIGRCRPKNQIDFQSSKPSQYHQTRMTSFTT